MVLQRNIGNGCISGRETDSDRLLQNKSKVVWFEILVELDSLTPLLFLRVKEIWQFLIKWGVMLQNKSKVVWFEILVEPDSLNPLLFQRFACNVIAAGIAFGSCSDT